MTALARQVMRANPDWNNEQVDRHLEETHGVKVRKATIYRAKQSLNNLKHYFHQNTDAKLLAEALAAPSRRSTVEESTD
jgi:predicted transcriptional regulator